MLNLLVSFLVGVFLYENNVWLLAKITVKTDKFENSVK